jgi:predicted nucleotidyltransferase
MEFKGSEVFIDTIKKYLDDKAQRNELFAVKYLNENKSIDDCIKYIISEVYKSGNNGFEDGEIYSMAVHYYEENDIKIDSDVDNIKVVVNHHVEITEEEKQIAKELALNEVIEEQKRNLTRKVVQKKKEKIQSLSLFDEAEE